MIKERPNVGDMVIVSELWRGPKVAVVEKVTPRGFIKVDGQLYNPDGTGRGTRGSLRIATPEKIKEIKDKEFITGVIYDMHRCRSLTIEQATAIQSILTGEVE